MNPNHSTSTLVVSAFALALTGLVAPSAMAQMSQADMMKQQEMTKAQVTSGKMEMCYGVALKGQNDCFAGAGTRVLFLCPESTSPGFG